MKVNSQFRRTMILAGVMASTVGAALSEASPAKTLAECYQAALKRSDTLAIQQELVKQAEDSYRQAIGAILPNLQGTGTYQWQQDTPSNVSNIFPNPAMNTKLVLTQPIFQGFKEFAGLSQTKALVGASQYDRKHAENQLHLDTATSYFSVVALEHDIDNINDELVYYEKRINELKQFKAIGRSQITDVLTAQALQSNLKAQLKQIQGQLRAQRAMISFLTGFDPTVAIARPQEIQVSSKPLETYLARVEVRPDVQRDSERVKAAEAAIRVARAGHFPTLSVQGDYYVQRTGALTNVNWDAILLLSVPIFSGGIVQSQVNQASSKQTQSELQLSQTRRLAEQQIRQYFESYVGDREQFLGYKVSTEISEKNYREELREFRLGLVTNLDVLQALTTFQESKRALDKARYSMLLDFQNLETAAAFRSDPPHSPSDMKNPSVT